MQDGNYWKRSIKGESEIMRTKLIEQVRGPIPKTMNGAQDKSLTDRARAIFRKHGFTNSELYRFRITTNDLSERFVTFAGVFDESKYRSFTNAEREIYSIRGLRLSTAQPYFPGNGLVVIKSAPPMLHGSGDD